MAGDLTEGYIEPAGGGLRDEGEVADAVLLVVYEYGCAGG